MVKGRVRKPDPLVCEGTLGCFQLNANTESEYRTNPLVDLIESQGMINGT